MRKNFLPINKIAFLFYLLFGLCFLSSQSWGVFFTDFDVRDNEKPTQVHARLFVSVDQETFVRGECSEDTRCMTCSIFPCCWGPVNAMCGPSWCFGIPCL